ncbi:Splicing factor 3a, subunit 1 [Phaffia rhodozyma]|uniref:Splicing factor 3a, subunit 1 n=1 Tax=Phaffia rhodozyma TaxID=264483 RepID=A0A0F7SI04_PHARH|nr:Splicing factor 3a, subunit 1 [Phaffia rhodozyma]
MSLVLPAPVNDHQEEILPVSRPEEGTDGNDVNLSESERLKAKLIYPPPEIRVLIDRTSAALHRSANPTQLESKIREGQKSDPKFSFLNSSDPYHTYYQYSLARLREGFAQDGAATAAGTGDGGDIDGTGERKSGAGKEDDLAGRPVEPRNLEFLVERPGMPSVDLDILKLTALFTARRGRSFLSSLSQREGRNYQFDFLRPTHSLYPVFNRMVQQYTRVLVPPLEALEELSLNAETRTGRENALKDSKIRLEWEKWRVDRAKKREDQKEAQRVAFAEIDWQDFVVVETIDFTTADESTELPTPTSIHDLENMTLAQKRMASQVNEVPLTAQEQAQYAQEEAAEEQVEIVQIDEQSEEDRLRKEEEERERERKKDVQRKFVEGQGPIKIRKDYVPKSRQTALAVPTTICSYCGQAIPIDEITEHIRIELLDPKWKERKEALDARKAQAGLLQQGANVSASLRDLASARTDMFGSTEDEQARKVREEQEKLQRREREKMGWDGQSSTKVSTMDKFQQNANFDEQIAAIHKAKGLAIVEDAAGPIGPGPSAFPVFNPAVPPPPITAPVLNPNGAIPPSIYPNYPPPPFNSIGAPTALPPASTPSAAPQGAPPSIHPSRMAVINGGAPHTSTEGATGENTNGAAATGSVRSREDDGTEGPDAKRSKVEKLPDGQLHSEEAWIASHPYPITLQIQLPKIDGKPELDGSLITLPALSLTTTVGILREKIQEATQTTLTLSKMRLDLPNGKVLNNKSSLASLNLTSGDSLTLGVRK